MKLYHAALFPKIFFKFNELFPDEKLNILLSYANTNYSVELFCLKQRDKIGGIILDSGTSKYHVKTVSLKDAKSSTGLKTMVVAILGTPMRSQRKL